MEDSAVYRPAQPTCQNQRMLPRGQQTPQLAASFATASANNSSPLYHPPMLGNRTNEQWISQYASSHQHPVNRACHTLGIPTIVLSVVLSLVSVFVHRLWPYALALFLLGWILQFIGHAFEGKPPEFFQDWRFLFVGLRWWWAKIQGKA